MTNPFDINALTSTVRLDNKGRGEVSFTVKNNSQSPIRGRAIPDADTSEIENWLIILGELERNFAAGGVHQYTMQVQVPPTAPAGNYPVKLKMVGTEDPDEIYTYSPTVSFEVGKPTAPAKPFPWWIVVVAAVVLVMVIAGIVVVATSGGDNNPTPTVAVTPNNSNQATVTAVAQLTATARAPFLFDFIQNAGNAKWVNSANTAIAFPSVPNPQGFVRLVNNAKLVDGRTVSRVLETHPQQVAGGAITGCFSTVYSATNPVQERDQIAGRVSFLQGSFNGNVSFRVKIVEGTNEKIVFSRQLLGSSNDSVPFTANLNDFNGKRVAICLEVQGVVAGNQNSAVWEDLRLIRVGL